MSEAKCLINGSEATAVAVTDRGLHYGDGLFETIAVRDGIPEFWDRHLQRLEWGCERLGMPMPDSGLLQAEAKRIGAGVRRAVLKLMLTRGSGGRGYRPPEHTRPTRILSLHPWPNYPETWRQEGVVVRVCRHRLSLNPSLAGVKHLNRLDQVLARSEWNDPAIAEGLMLDLDDGVIEGTMSNLFLVREGRLLTPDLTQAGIHGVLRGVIMEMAAALGICCTAGRLNLHDLACADELLLCNSVIGIWPVRQLEQTTYMAPGPVTRRLDHGLEEIRLACNP